MLSYVVPVVLKKPIVVLKDNRDRSTKGRLQKQEQRTTMPCGLYLRIVPTYFLHITYILFGRFIFIHYLCPIVPFFGGRNGAFTG